MQGAFVLQKNKRPPANAESRCLPHARVVNPHTWQRLLAAAIGFEPVIDEQDEHARQHFHDKARNRDRKHIATPFTVQVSGATARVLYHESAFFEHCLLTRKRTNPQGKINLWRRIL